MALWVVVHGQVTSAKTSPYCDVTHREAPLRTKDNFLKSELQDLLNPKKV